MFSRKTTSGIRGVDNIVDEIYRILNLLEVGSTATRSRSFYGIPIYLSHSLAPIPPTGYVTEYYLHNDYDFKYMLWPDGSRHNRRLPLSFEVDE